MPSAVGTGAVVAAPASTGRAISRHGPGFTLAQVGTLDGSGVLRLAADGEEAPVWDLGEQDLTGLRPPVVTVEP